MTKMRTAIRTFHLPSRIPDEKQLKAAARELMFPYEHVVIEAPSDGVHVKQANVRPLTEDERHPLGENVLRITVLHSEDPGDLMDHLRRRLHLRARGRRRGPSEREVKTFLQDVSQRPRAYTASIIQAQLDEWGPRVVPLLQAKAWDSDAAVQAAEYMRRYLARAYPESANEGAASLFLEDREFPRGAKPIAEGAAVSMNGWPMRGVMPQMASVHLFTKVDLIAGWQKEEIAQRMSHGIVDGAIAVRTSSWPGSGYLGPQKYAVIQSDSVAEDLPKIMAGVPIQLLTARSPALPDDLTMLVRAAQLIGNRDIALRSRSVGRPQWWRMKASLATRRAQRKLMGEVFTALNIKDGGMRVFTHDWWMRMRDGYVVRMDFGHDDSLGPRVYGVIAEADEAEDLDDMKRYIRMYFTGRGRRIDGPEEIAIQGGGASGGVQLAPMLSHARASFITTLLTRVPR